MKDFLSTIDYEQALDTIITVFIVPLLTYIISLVKKYIEDKKLDNIADKLVNAVKAAVKSVYEDNVKHIKYTEEWTDDKQAEVREMAKNIAYSALTNRELQKLKDSNSDLDVYVDSLIGTALYDEKHKSENNTNTDTKAVTTYSINC